MGIVATWLILAFAGGVAWFVSTVAAGGAATLLIAGIAFVVGPGAVAPVITVASLVANPSRVLLFRGAIDWRVLTFLMPGTALGAALGALLYSRLQPHWLELLLGVFLIGSSLARVGRQAGTPGAVPGLHRAWFAPLGTAVGALSGLVGATGPVLNPFLLKYGLVKEQLVGTKSVNALLMQAVKLSGYAAFGAMSLELAGYGVAAGVGAVAGVALARRHLLAIDAARFRRYVFLLMAASGIAMVIRGGLALTMGG